MKTVNIEEIDNQLFRAKYIHKNAETVDEIWRLISSDSAFLYDATIVVDDHITRTKTFLGPTICDMLLEKPFDNLSAYYQLVEKILKDEDLARLDFGRNGTFLTMIIKNNNYDLNDNQRQFVVAEANKIYGTKSSLEEIHMMIANHLKNSKEELTQKDKDKIYDEAVNKYCGGLNDSYSDPQNHGNSAFDLRYYILKNTSFNEEEKKRLVKDFYYTDQFFYDYYNSWIDRIREKLSTRMDPTKFTYEQVLKTIKNSELAQEIFDEILFCNEMLEHRLDLKSELQRK